ncbi:MAG: sodium:proton antiporter [Paralcaligenes sp.]
MGEHNVLVLATIGVAAMMCQWVAWRLRLPAILFLLLTGLAAGPMMGWLNPDAVFGDLLFPFISMSVAVVLFEGSLTLQLHEIRGLEKVVRRLVSTGMLITWLVTTVAAHWLMDFPWELAFLFGAITVVTGPTVIAPLLRTVRPVAAVANTLRWEGIIIDPVGALLAVLAYELISSLKYSTGLPHALLIFGQTILTGLAMGIAAGFIISEILRRNWLADFLINVTVLAFMLAVFAVSNELQHESGLLTVTIMGIWMANHKDVQTAEILEFKETLSLMLVSVLFIILAARVDSASLLALGWKGFAVLAVMLFVARPLKVIFSAWGSNLSWRERGLLAWIAPRGIVAAAVSALFSLRLEDSGLAHVDQLLPLTFLVIVGTVVLQSLTARPLAVALKVAEPEPVGFLIVGANPLARAIGSVLHKANIPVRLCDTDWDSVVKARMEGLPTYYGSPVSEHARRNLDMAGLGRVLALGVGDHFNELVTTRYRDELGRSKVYSLPAAHDDEGTNEHRAAAMRTGRKLFTPDLGYWKLSAILAQGGAIHGTTLSEAFNYAQYTNSHKGLAIPLFAINPKGYAEPCTPDNELIPGPGWTVLSLSSREAEIERVGAKLNKQTPDKPN